jgi:hypothetical protein
VIVARIEGAIGEELLLVPHDAGQEGVDHLGSAPLRMACSVR